MARLSWWVAGEGVLVAALLALALVVFGRSAAAVEFNGDEGRQISTSRYFSYLFLERDLGRPEWGDNYWTHTQPMLTRFIVGGWLWARGYDLAELPQPFDFSKSFRLNKREGRVPEDSLLADARAPMVGLATGSVLLLYLLGRALGGPLAGLVAAGLTLTNPVAQEHLVQAVSQAPLGFFLLLGLLLALLGARRGRVGSLPVGWAVGAGAALGLAIGAKLTAVLSVVAILGWGSLVALLAARRGSGAVAGQVRRGWAVGRGWLLAAAVAYGVFVLADPHLYSGPLQHTAHLFERRANEMRHQQETVPDRFVIEEQWQQPIFVLGHTLVGSTWGGSRGLPFEAALAAVGGIGLASAIWRGWRLSGQLPAEGLLVLTALIYFAVISATILLFWERYLIPTIFLSMLPSGLGASMLVGRARRLRDLKGFAPAGWRWRGLEAGGWTRRA